jgi:hypothetical protein
MKENILKIVNRIKEDLKDIDSDGVQHELLDSIYDSLTEIEEEIYEDDAISVIDIWDEEDTAI